MFLHPLNNFLTAFAQASFEYLRCWLGLHCTVFARHSVAGCLFFSKHLRVRVAKIAYPSLVLCMLTPVCLSRYICVSVGMVAGCVAKGGCVLCKWIYIRDCAMSVKLQHGILGLVKARAVDQIN